MDDRLRGAVWVFARADTRWVEQGEWQPPSTTGYQEFGGSLALSADGRTAVVGAPAEESFRGAVWIYTRTGAAWTKQPVRLTGDGERGPGDFGSAVAVSGDGQTVIVGAPFDQPVQAVGRGAVWVFVRRGSRWVQQGPKFTARAADKRAEFGRSVALSSDGTTALIGAFNQLDGRGSAWVFVRNQSKWLQQGAALQGRGASKAAGIGDDVALSANGNIALVGGAGNDKNRGAAWIFIRHHSTWNEQGSVLLGGGEIGQATFGVSVALSASGSTALIGGYSDDSLAGAAWVFRVRDGIWVARQPKLAEQAGAFGFSVALSADGTIALIGCPLHQDKRGTAWIMRVK